MFHWAGGACDWLVVTQLPGYQTLCSPVHIILTICLYSIKMKYFISSNPIKLETKDNFSNEKLTDQCFHGLTNCKYCKTVEDKAIVLYRLPLAEMSRPDSTRRSLHCCISYRKLCNGPAIMLHARPPAQPSAAKNVDWNVLMHRGACCTLWSQGWQGKSSRSSLIWSNLRPGVSPQAVWS